MKTCSACGRTKAREQFYKQTAAKDGMQSRCIVCVKTDGAKRWAQIPPEIGRAENKKRYSREYHAQRYQAQRDRLLELCRLNRVNNPAKRRKLVAEYKRRNAGKVLSDTRRRQANKLKATPSWADQKAIEAFYIEAVRLSEETGIPHQVDHIFPLKGKTCCGLHVENNLQILTAAANMSKGNRMPAIGLA